MNHLIIKEIYRVSLLTKLNQYPENELKTIIKENDTFRDIQKMVSKNDLYFINYEKEKCCIFKYLNTIYVLYYHNDNNTKQNKLIHWKNNIYVYKNIFDISFNIKDQIIKYINILDNEDKIKKIYISGYEYGGTIATFLAGILAEYYSNMYLVSCITFGSPYIDNTNFQNFFQKHINSNYRIILQDDVNNFEKQYNHRQLILCNDNIYFDTVINPSYFKCIKKKILKCFKNNIKEYPHHFDLYIKNLQNIILLQKANSSNESQTTSNENSNSINVSISNSNNTSNSRTTSRGSSKSPTSIVNTPNNEHNGMQSLNSSISLKLLNDISTKLISINDLLLIYFKSKNVDLSQVLQQDIFDDSKMFSFNVIDRPQ